MQKKKHEIELNKLQKSEIRHSKNVMNEKEKFQQKANDNKEKLMKKYISFYWNRRNRKKNKKINICILMKNMMKNWEDQKKLRGILKKKEKIY